MTKQVSLIDINTMERSAFVARLGGVFEHSPWVAERVCSKRPFASTSALHCAMVEAVRDAGRDQQLSLIRAHPELAGKAARDGVLTRESTTEQLSAGLDRCTSDELGEIGELNRAYLEKFTFPFIMAVKGRSKAEVLDAMRARLGHSQEQAFEASLDQIARIAMLRLDDLIEDRSE